jgi:hypothetical protein
MFKSSPSQFQMNPVGAGRTLDSSKMIVRPKANNRKARSLTQETLAHAAALDNPVRAWAAASDGARKLAELGQKIFLQQAIEALARLHAIPNLLEVLDTSETGPRGDTIVTWESSHDSGYGYARASKIRNARTLVQGG